MDPIAGIVCPDIRVEIYELNDVTRPIFQQLLKREIEKNGFIDSLRNVTINPPPARQIPTPTPCTPAPTPEPEPPAKHKVLGCRPVHTNELAVWMQDQHKPIVDIKAFLEKKSLQFLDVEKAISRLCAQGDILQMGPTTFKLYFTQEVDHGEEKEDP